MVKGNKEGGFTFLEMILVLSIVTLITVIILPIGDKWIRTSSEEDGLQAFVAAIHNLQAYSMANHVATRLDFKNSGTMYITLVPGKTEFARTTFPAGMKLVGFKSYESSGISCEWGYCKFWHTCP